MLRASDASDGGEDNHQERRIPTDRFVKGVRQQVVKYRLLTYPEDYSDDQREELFNHTRIKCQLAHERSMVLKEICYTKQRKTMQEIRKRVVKYKKQIGIERQFADDAEKIARQLVDNEAKKIFDEEKNRRQYVVEQLQIYAKC